MLYFDELATACHIRSSLILNVPRVRILFTVQHTGQIDWKSLILLRNCFQFKHMLYLGHEMITLILQ